jgi:hypothetical protein
MIEAMYSSTQYESRELKDTRCLNNINILQKTISISLQDAAATDTVDTIARSDRCGAAL